MFCDSLIYATVLIVFVNSAELVDKPCVFPFYYWDSWYSHCITAHNGHEYWCATATEYSSNVEYVKCEFCRSDTCKNGGKCWDTVHEQFKCSCKAGFTGHRCQTAVTASEDNVGECHFPFIYGGKEHNKCTTGGVSAQSWCATTKNFDKDKKWRKCASCADNFCENGLCFDTSYGEAFCTCTDGYYGINCENQMTAVRDPVKDRGKKMREGLFVFDKLAFKVGKLIGGPVGKALSVLHFYISSLKLLKPTLSAWEEVRDLVRAEIAGQLTDYHSDLLVLRIEDFLADMEYNTLPTDDENVKSRQNFNLQALERRMDGEINTLKVYRISSLTYHPDIFATIPVFLSSYVALLRQLSEDALYSNWKERTASFLLEMREIITNVYTWGVNQRFSPKILLGKSYYMTKKSFDLNDKVTGKDFTVVIKDDLSAFYELETDLNSLFDDILIRPFNKLATACRTFGEICDKVTPINGMYITYISTFAKDNNGRQCLAPCRSYGSSYDWCAYGTNYDPTADDKEKMKDFSAWRKSVMLWEKCSR